MINERKKRDVQRKRRTFRVRNKVRGSAVKPRLSVFKSNVHIYAQLIDDESGKTLVGIGTMGDVCKGQFEKKSKEACKFIGMKLAEKASELGIEKVVFDRGHNSYHGLLKELADSARSAGLKF
jgi:large subunit ribosomal protein L18